MARKTFKKVITDPNLIEQIHPDNKKLMKLFLQDKNRKCSDATMKGYTSDLNIFFCWVVKYGDNVFYPKMKKYELSNFFSYCVDELKWNGARFARMRSVLSGLSDTVIKYYDEEFPTFRNIINTVVEAIPKEPVREKTILEDDDLQKLLDWLDKDKNLPAEACLLALAVYSGCRVSELELFKINTIDENLTAFGGLMLETSHKIRTKGFGKAGKQLNKYIIKDLFLPYYKKYIDYREEIIKNTGSDTDALFIQKDGTPATVVTFNSWKNKWEKFLGADLYFHNYRHFFTTKLTLLGLSDEIIIAMVGWSSPEMKKIYTDIEDKDKDWGKDINKLQAFVQSVEVGEE